MRSSVVLSSLLSTVCSVCLVTICAAKDSSQSGCVMPGQDDHAPSKCTTTDSKVSYEGKEEIRSCVVTGLECRKDSCGRFCFYRTDTLDNYKCCTTEADLQFCALTGVYVNQEEGTRKKLGCSLKRSRVPDTKTYYWQLEVEEGAVCDVTCLYEYPIVDSRRRRRKFDPYLVEANDTVDLGAIQFMAPRRINKETRSEAWMCALTGMHIEVPMGRSDHSGYCRMYVDDRKWALGGWSGLAFEKNARKNLHTSCQGHCGNTLTEDEYLLQGLFHADFTESGEIGINSGEPGKSGIIHCFLSYVNIQRSATGGKNPDKTGNSGCNLVISEDLWLMEITKGGSLSVSCGAVCFCKNKKGDSPTTGPKCIPLYSIQPETSSEKVDTEVDDTDTALSFFQIPMSSGCFLVLTILLLVTVVYWKLGQKRAQEGEETHDKHK